MNTVTSTYPIQILIDEKELDFDQGIHLNEVQVHQKLNYPAQCILSCVCEQEQLLPSSCKAGNQLSITVGTSENSLLFNGFITGVNYSCDSGKRFTFDIKAYDDFYQLRINSAVKVYNSVTVAELFKDFTSGLSIESKVCAGGSSKIEMIFQQGESHYDLLMDRCTRAGMYVAPTPNSLALVNLKGTGDSVSLDIDKNLLSFSLKQDGLRSACKVNVQGWVPGTSEKIDGDSSKPAAVSGTHSYTSDRIKGDGTVSLRNHPFGNAKEAKDLAQSVQDSRYMTESVIEGICEGTAELFPGVSVAIRNAAYLDNDRFVLGEVLHSITSSGGYQCRFNSSFPVARIPETQASFTTAQVSRVDDPESAARIKVTFPACNDLESPWLQVLLPAAGQNHGFIAVPSPGDSVIVLQMDNDLSHAVVLGGVFAGKSAPSDGGVDGNNVKQYHLITPQGHKISMDDKGQELSVCHSGGSEFVFSNDSTRLTSQGALTIEAPGNTIEMKAAKIDMKNG